jgi:peroxiredoxin
MSCRFWTAFFAGLLLTANAHGQAPAELRAEAPELEERPAEEWINSKPLKLADLRGQVVVLHFWTFGCINCIHNQPHYKSWHEKFSEKGVTIIGVHTPETDGERNINSVRKSAKDKGLKYPIVIDQDAKTWNTWGNRWWPCTYLIDKNGIVRYRWDGELNWKKTKGESMMRKKIEELLAEPDPKREKSADAKGKKLLKADAPKRDNAEIGVDAQTSGEKDKDKADTPPSKANRGK